MTIIAISIVVIAVLALLVAIDLRRATTRALDRIGAPGSLPRARGFEAAAERHFGNPGNRIAKFNPWQAQRDKRLGIVPADAVPLYPECP